MLKHPLASVILAGALFLLLACISLALLDWRDREAAWQRELNTLSGLHVATMAAQEQDLKTLTETAARLLAANPDVIDSLRIATALVAAQSGGSYDPFVGQLRQQIRAEMESYWQALQPGGVDRVYFYVAPNNTAFLRLHRPNDFGDDVSSIRPMVSSAFAEGELLSGFEEGQSGLSYRTVVPVRADDNPLSPVVAAIEVGHSVAPAVVGDQLEQVRYATVRGSLGAFQLQNWPSAVAEWFNNANSEDLVDRSQVISDGPSSWLVSAYPGYGYRGPAAATPYVTQLALQDITEAVRSHRNGLTTVVRQWVLIYLSTSLLLAVVLWLTYQFASNQQQKHEKEMTAMQRLAKLGHWELDLHDGKAMWSEVMYELYGQNPHTYQPTLAGYAALVHPDDVVALREHGASAEQYGSFDHEHRIVLPDGQVKWVHEIAQVYLDAKGKPMRMVGTTQDITERKRLDQLQRDFVSTVTHELRTPLTSISGALSLLVADALKDHPEQRDHMLQIAHQNSQRLLSLINDLLDMDKLLAGKVAFQSEWLVLDTVLRDSIEGVRQYAQQFDVAIRYQPLNNEVLVFADRQRLEQVMANLLSNAAKFSGAGTEVTVSAERVPEGVSIGVQDQGPGIPESARDHLFSRFFQVDASDTRQQGGTGLGLAISRELAEKMHGNLRFDSTPGKGASFYLTLTKIQSAK